LVTDNNQLEILSLKKESAGIGEGTYLWKWDMFADVPLAEFVDLTQ